MMKERLKEAKVRFSAFPLWKKVLLYTISPLVPIWLCGMGIGYCIFVWPSETYDELFGEKEEA